MLRTIQEASLRGKKVLMRAGFDVVIDEAGNIIDDTRIKEALPTIKYILEQRPENLTIISHLDRPKGRVVENLKLSHVAKRLAKLLMNSPEIAELFGIEPTPKNLELDGFQAYEISRYIRLLENIRFYPEEEKNDAAFSKKLATLGEIFVFEAFSAAHREQASVTSIMDYLPSYSGLQMEKEITELSKLLGEVERPYVVIIGGAKTEDKAPVIESLKNKADKILVGGRTSNLLWSEKKYQNEDNIILHQDGIDKDKKVIKAATDPMAALDIGPETIKLFRGEIIKAKTVLAAGPLGKIEEPAYQNGSKEIFFAVGYSQAYKVACGGDTIEVLNKFGLYQNFNFVSSGGGAALEFLAKGTLPAIEKLESKK